MAVAPQPNGGKGTTEAQRTQRRAEDDEIRKVTFFLARDMPSSAILRVLCAFASSFPS
jgi:hypothetical protein